MKTEKNQRFFEFLKVGLSKKIIILIIMLMIAVPLVSADKIRVGGEKVIYDEVIEGDSDFDGINDRTSYYLEDVLVFSAYDTNSDGEPDMWFTYVNETYPEIAMRDTTGDGKPENVISYNEKGEIINEEVRENRPWGLIILIAIVVAGAGTYYVVRKTKKKKRK